MSSTSVVLTQESRYVRPVLSARCVASAGSAIRIRRRCRAASRFGSRPRAPPWCRHFTPRTRTGGGQPGAHFHRGSRPQLGPDASDVQRLATGTSGCRPRPPHAWRTWSVRTFRFTTRGRMRSPCATATSARCSVRPTPNRYYLWTGRDGNDGKGAPVIANDEIGYDLDDLSGAAAGGGDQLEDISPAGFERFFAELIDLGGVAQAGPERSGSSVSASHLRWTPAACPISSSASESASQPSHSPSTAPDELARRAVEVRG